MRATLSFVMRPKATRSWPSMPSRWASDSSASPPPTDMSAASLSLLPSMNSDVFQVEVTLPSCVQPDVPEVMPNVWLPNVPLVVTASTCGARPDWPSNSFEPQPHWPTLSAIAATGASTRETATQIFFMKPPRRLVGLLQQLQPDSID